MPSQRTQLDAPRHATRTWGLIAFGALAASVACTGPSAPTAKPPARNVAVTEPSKTEKSNRQTAAQSHVPWLLSQLRGPDVKLREKAIAEIGAMSRIVGLSPDEVTLVLSAASKDLPPAQITFHPYDLSLLTAAAPHMKAEHVRLLVARYPQFSAKAQPEAIRALASLGATDALLALLRSEGWPEEAGSGVLKPFEGTSALEQQLLPALFDGSIARFDESLGYLLVLSASEKHELSPSLAAQIRPKAIQFAKARAALLAPLQQEQGTDWRFDESYAAGRYDTGLVLDVLGHLGKDVDSVAVLREGEKLLDPHPRAFAVLSLVRLGEHPSEAALRAVAADAEMRNTFFHGLVELGEVSLFPKSERTQEEFAESDMVRWLVYPTELARVPTRIELMKKVERDLGPDIGVLVYYVFRFRSDAPEWKDKGWMAGVSGPFDNKDLTTTSGGDTFSEFEPWTKSSPEEHVASVEELLEEWREKHAKKTAE